ncbi:MAG: phytanoyl-CoA dioxygenase family protein [Planctomycetes bacterium]|nr:phytanoyl-CoA dioxygenase family protein [Planctomycetota bacterium]
MINTTVVNQQSVETYAKEGYVIVRNLIQPEYIQSLYVDVMDVLASKNMPDSFLSQSSAYLKGSALDHLNNGPELQKSVSRLMGGESSLYLPFTAVKGPHQGPFKFHQDNNYTKHEGESCNCWIALSPCNAKTGGLQVVPGGHLNGTVASKPMFEEGYTMVADEPDEWIDIDLNPGDAIIFSRLCIHGSGSNNTDQARVAYAIQFHRNDTKWYDPETDSWSLLKDKIRFDVGPKEELQKSG